MRWPSGVDGSGMGLREGGVEVRWSFGPRFRHVGFRCQQKWDGLHSLSEGTMGLLPKVLLGRLRVSTEVGWLSVVE